MKKKLNILAISPHADDVEIAMGGTIAKFIKDKHNVTILTAITYFILMMFLTYARL